MDNMKTDNLTEQQKIDITFETNALGEAIAENAALRSRLETLEQKLQSLTETKGHNQQIACPRTTNKTVSLI
jgi:hypothetical protein